MIIDILISPLVNHHLEKYFSSPLPAKSHPKNGVIFSIKRARFMERTRESVKT